MSQAIRQPDFIGAYTRGQQAGVEAAQQREQVKLLTAQRIAAEAAIRPETNSGYWVMYQCPDATGTLVASAVPAVGCLVDFVRPTRHPLGGSDVLRFAARLLK